MPGAGGKPGTCRQTDRQAAARRGSGLAGRQGANAWKPQASLASWAGGGPGD